MTKMWNKTTGTVFLKSIDNNVVPNFRSFYPGVSMIGKHFKLRTSNHMQTNRHYTICNVMRPSLYEPLIDCLTLGDSRELLSE